MPEGFVVPSTGGRGFLFVSQDAQAVSVAPYASNATRAGAARVILERPLFVAPPERDYATELGGATFDGQNYVLTWGETDAPPPEYWIVDRDPTLKLARVTPGGEILDRGEIGRASCRERV